MTAPNLLESSEQADHAAFHLLTARVDGEMVAAALAYDFGDDCGIYNVGTVPVEGER